MEPDGWWPILLDGMAGALIGAVLGFVGSLVGSVIGLAGVYLVFQWTLREDRKLEADRRAHEVQREAERRDYDARQAARRRVEGVLARGYNPDRLFYGFRSHNQWIELREEHGLSPNIS